MNRVWYEIVPEEDMLELGFLLVDLLDGLAALGLGGVAVADRERGLGGSLLHEKHAMCYAEDADIDGRR